MHASLLAKSEARDALRVLVVERIKRWSKLGSVFLHEVQNHNVEQRRAVRAPALPLQRGLWALEDQRKGV